MNKVAHYLQQHLVGEVLTSPDVLKYFSTDESIFEIKPMLVVHPRNENDLRKTARFSWQLAERGRSIPITIKGKGTDQTGASLGNGIILSTPAHMNKVIELDPKSGVVSVETGALVGKLQQTLYTHGRFLPSVSSASEYSTIGGVVANNDAGSDSYKYGPVREFVQGLRVTLANGELIKTGRLSKREFNKKLGLASFEGEIYRQLDGLLVDNAELIAGSQKDVSKNFYY
jgi:FAD/FMN-containing dehydrogenase